MSAFATTRYDSIIATYGDDHFNRIWNSKVLVVGAGGIGCEILKNLALSGFRNVEVIDLDTIDVSNLNRQFLFRPEHVGMSKASVAAGAVKRFNADIQVVAHHANVKDAKYGISYFEGFHVVLNALDNVDARRHVNRMCLAANVPLIDAGTTGYLGQVMPIFKKKTACYECIPKPTQKVYPICTIRSTPDKPVHCIVWAKECYKLLFGNMKDSMLYEDPSSGDISAFMDAVPLPSNRDEASLVSYGSHLIEALYVKEIQKRIAMEVYKTAKNPPAPTEALVISQGCERAQQLLSTNSSSNKIDPEELHGKEWDRTVFTDVQCVTEITICIHDIVTHSAASLGMLSFEKDDDVCMRFVSAAANLRCRVFSIPAVSFHEAKGIAGNIIPAIATTNAIVAGLQVIQACKLLHPSLSEEEKVAACSHVYCLRAPTRRGYFLQPTKPEGPSKNCYVCNIAQVTLQVDTTVMTLGDLVKQVLKGKLGFSQPSIMQGSNILYEEGDGADESLEENLPLQLDRCPGGGIADGSQLVVEDFTQSLEVTLLIRHIAREVFQNSETESVVADGFLLGTDPAEAHVRSAVPNGEEPREAATEEIAVVSKRKLDEFHPEQVAESNDGSKAKRLKTESENDDCFVVD